MTTNETKQTNECSMCKYYGRPGWVMNAMQWCHCWNCNPEAQPMLCMSEILDPDDIIRKCKLPKGHGDYCHSGTA